MTINSLNKAYHPSQLVAGILFLLVPLFIAACSHNSAAGESTAIVSNLKDNETVVFFNTYAIPPQESDNWTIPIHGWVYRPVESVNRKGFFANILKNKYGLEVTPETQANFDQRINLFLTKDKQNRKMVVHIGDQSRLLEPSEFNGHFNSQLDLDENSIRKLNNDGVLHYKLVLDSSDQRELHGKVLFTERAGISVISDIDDTIKITEVLDSGQMFENTFYNDFKAVPGMAELYRNWAEQGANIHLVTSSPWQLYVPIKDFLEQNNFPPTTFSMKYFRLTDNTFFNIFKKGDKTKPEQIKPILEAFPKHKFILVGDSGEKDPEVYAKLAHEYPEQIARIYIRQLEEENSDRDYETVFTGIPTEKWQIYTQPEQLERNLAPLLQKLEQYASQISDSTVH